jgi:hypothetical protein
LQDNVLNVPQLPAGTTGIFAAFEFSDKWAGFLADIDTLLSFIAQNGITNVIVLSGDSHTAAIDDGTNAGLPEIMAGGLDITNSRIVALMNEFGINIWNKGGQGVSPPDFYNAYGRVTVFGEDSVQLAIDEFDARDLPFGHECDKRRRWRERFATGNLLSRIIRIRSIPRPESGSPLKRERDRRGRCTAHPEGGRYAGA